MADVTKLLRDLDHIGKLARMARPSNGAAEGEREQASKLIEAAVVTCVDAVKALGAARPSAPPPSTSGYPWTGRSALAAYWVKEMGDETLPADFERSITRFGKSMTREQIKDAIDTTAAKVARGSVDANSAFRYFCGICWRTIRPKDDE